MTKAKAVIVPVTPFQQNCTLLWCEVTKRAALPATFHQKFI
jgi:hydroxyacylglutathione hydrolase